MTKFTFIHFLILTTLLTSNLSSTTQQNITNNLVKTSCNKTPNPHLCEASLGSDPRSSGADTEGLIMIMIDVVKTHFNDSLHVAQDLRRKVHEEDVIRALHTCVRVYKVVLDYNIGMAMNAVRLGDPKFGEQAMVDSGNEAEACYNGFSKGSVPQQLSGRTRTLHDVSIVAASLIKDLE